jgi:hypothetical protein
MARGDTLVSPWAWSAADYLGRAITISVAFNDSTRALGTTTVTRDAGCLWGTLIIGDPTGTPKTFPVPAGTSTISATKLRNQGLNTIEDVLALQITAGP